MRLHDPFDYRVREQPEAEFAVCGARRLDYGEAGRRVDRMASALVAGGLAPGDRVAILSKNQIELALLYYAASKAGVVPVPLNYRLAPSEWVWIVNDAAAPWLIAQPAFSEALAPLRGEMPRVTRLLTVNGGPGEGPPGWERFEALEEAAPSDPPDREVSPDADVYQMYTSGTTGRPKGAMLTHRAVSAQLHQASLAFAAGEGDRSLIVAPLYHAAAAVTAFVAVQAGGSLFVQEEFDPRETVRALSEERIAMALLVPAMIQFCLVAVPDAAERRYDDLRLVVYGASPIAEETLRRAIEVFRCDFLQGYGMTETTAAATYLFPRDHRRALSGRPELLASAGRPLLGTEVRVVDAEGRPLPAGEIGEIAVRGPQLMRGYWNRPEASEEALRGGWMHTGDAGRLDAEGYLYVQDRVKDMIVSGGENVYPREVEDALFEHPDVADAAVIGVPDESWGETVKAVVVLREGAAADERALLDFCKDRLGGFKRPRSVDFVEALPRNPSGKVLKKELREPYWAGRSRRVG